MLWRKLLRDLWQERWQTIPILLVLGLGTAVFVACFIGYDSLAASYAATQERTHLADMTLEVTGVSPDQLRLVREQPGVADALVQTVATLPVRLGNASAEARLLGIPLGAQPPINQLVVETGHYPAAADEVLVERHFAAYHGLEPGSLLRLVTASGERRLAVAGVAVSAEYLWVARNSFDIMPSAADFGVLFVPESALPSSGAERLLYRLSPGADPDATLARVKGVLGSGTVLAATRRADLIGIRLLQDDIDGFAEIAVIVPVFFLVVVILVLATIMTRRVDRERPVIGTLLALGVSRRSVLAHYLGYGLATGLLATALGCAAGVLLGYQFAGAYVRELLIPFVTLRVNGWVPATAVVLGLAAALLACLLPARRAAGFRPAEAMRPFLSNRAPRLRGRTGPHSRTPLMLRMALRNLGRQPLRTAGSVTGVLAALVLLVGTGGMMDSTSRLLDLALEEGPRYDLRADFSLLQPASQLNAAVRTIDGVKAVETILCLPVQVRRAGGGAAESTVAEILPLESPLLQVLATNGRSLTAGAREVVLAESIAHQLGVGVGDEVELVQSASGRKITRTVGALSGTFLTEPVALFGPEAGAEFGVPELASTVLVRVAPDRTADVRAALAKLPGATRLTAMPQLRRQINELMGLAYVIIGMLFGSGAVLAGCVLFNTVTMSVTERRRELATMRADGHSMRSITGVITLENLATGVVGAALGLPLGVLVLRQIVATFNSELFSMPFIVKPATLLLASGAILLVMLAAEAPALLMIGRTDLAEATRTRE